jgi:hypothetical protein
MACLNWRRYRYRRGAVRGCVCQAEELDQAERILEHAVQPSAIIDYFEYAAGRALELGAARAAARSRIVDPDDDDAALEE